MAGVEDMIKAAVRSVNSNTHGTPNEITRFYADRNGSLFLNELWCNMSITFWAFQSGNHAAVCFGTDFAWTKAHADRFRAAGRFHDGASGIRRGDIVFFGRSGIQGIGHIGLVRRVEGDILRTIEGNSSNAVRHRAHPISAGRVVGYGRPDYAGAEEDDMTEEQARQLNAIFQALTVPGTKSPEETMNLLFTRVRNIEAAINVHGTKSAEEAFDKLFNRVKHIEQVVNDIKKKV
jgi:CHAP domain